MIVPRRRCRAGYLGDRLSGRAAEGYVCNHEMVGEFESASFANLDSYRDCVSYTDNPGGSGMAEGGGVVLDVSDPANPVKTDYLTVRAMGNGGESLRVNRKRGLLVTNHYNTLQTSADAELVRALAVYDLKQDCRHPRLLADVIMAEAEGHEGCFQPDGMASTKTITPIDLTDPRKPKQLSAPWPLGIHGCSISDDRKRGYFAELGNNPFMAAHAASKHAVEGYSESLDHEVREHGVRVLLVEPAYTTTGFDANAPRPDKPLPIYAEQRRTADNLMTAAIKDGDDPAVVAKVIVAAATDPMPKLRYTAGSTAGRVSTLRRIVPARAFDRQIRKLNRLAG